MSRKATFGRIRTLLAGAVIGVGGCACPLVVDSHPRVTAPGYLDRAPLPAKRPPAASPAQHPEIVQAQHVEPAPLPDRVGVDDLVALAVARNPRIGKATFAIGAARGRHIQAGLYPNPDLALNWDEIGDRTGPGGIISLPKLTQTIVTGRKLTLSQAVAAAEVDQATLALLRERYSVIAAVRAAYYDVFTLERRIETLDELLRLADQALKHGQNLFDNQKLARLD